jgi:outer membrane receptor protein involved in Fe transport
VRRTWSTWLAGFAAVLALAVFSAPASAQTGKITGIVTDAASGAPLDGAQVILQGTGFRALTGSNGRFFLINIPPGTYSVLVRRIGYQGAEVTNVQIQIDVTREVSFPLSQANAINVDSIVIRDEVAPLVQPGTTGSSSNIQAAEIAALPVTNIQGVLALQQGFLEVPQNTDIVAFTDTRRNPINPIAIRGGRGGETQTQIDGVPINNFVFGGPAFDITTQAIEQLDFKRGGFESQYGNALSGIIDIATREGGSRLAGALSLRSSVVGGALGNRSDELLNRTLLEGFVSGSVPGTSSKLRFMLAGRTQTGADQVQEFDTDVATPGVDNPGGNDPQARDLFSGWRAFGYDDLRDMTSKLTFYFRPTMKLSLTGITYRRQRQGFDFDWILVGFNALNAPAVNSLEDSISLGGGSGIASQQDVVLASIKVDRDLYTARWDHTIGRWAYTIAGGRFDQKRETCNFFQGVCLGRRFADINFTEQFVNSGVTESHPGTDQFFGGEDLSTMAGRIDIKGQATDHHFLQAGAFYQRHDLVYQEFRNVGVNDVLVIPIFYSGKPWDAALYVSDRIEYDFLTVKLGARFDMGEAGGLFFADPRDPTNGTTAREVCNGEYTRPDGTTVPAYTDTLGNTGFAACTADRALLTAATAEAQGDDFTTNRRRNQFSPRIGVSFPLSERSLVFFNFGRFSQNPLYNNVYQNTGTGTVAGDSMGVCDANAIIPGTRTDNFPGQCHPIIFNTAFNTGLLGNPNLLIEKTTSYEIGYSTELGADYALQVTAFSKDQFGLTGVRQAGIDALGNRTFDVGSTYGTSQYEYSVLVNQDFQTVRGFEVSLRRRLSDFWGFNVNYAYGQATTNASAPEQEFQRVGEENDPVQNQEITSQIDQPHVFNASVFFRVGREQPFGVGVFDAIVRNSNMSFTVQAASGLPYTPTVTFAGTGGNGQLQRNSGRAPGTFTVNAQVGKDFQFANVRYGAFLQVSNLLDAKNCRQVFPSTGRCDAGAIDQDRRQNGNTINDGASSTSFDRPTFYSARRSINFGARMNF